MSQNNLLGGLTSMWNQWRSAPEQPQVPQYRQQGQVPQNHRGTNGLAAGGGAGGGGGANGGGGPMADAFLAAQSAAHARARSRTKSVAREDVDSYQRPHSPGIDSEPPSSPRLKSRTGSQLNGWSLNDLDNSGHSLDAPTPRKHVDSPMLQNGHRTMQNGRAAHDTPSSPTSGRAIWRSETMATDDGYHGDLEAAQAAQEDRRSGSFQPPKLPNIPAGGMGQHMQSPSQSNGWKSEDSYHHSTSPSQSSGNGSVPTHPSATTSSPSVRRASVGFPMSLGLAMPPFGHMRAEVEAHRMQEDLDEARRGWEEARRKAEEWKARAEKEAEMVKKLREEIESRDARIRQLDRIAAHCRRTHIASTSRPSGGRATPADPSEPPPPPPPRPKPVALESLATTLAGLPGEVEKETIEIRQTRQKVDRARREAREGIERVKELARRVAGDRPHTPPPRSMSPVSTPTRVPNPPPPTPSIPSGGGHGANHASAATVRSLEARLAETAARRAVSGSGAGSLHRRRSSGWSGGGRVGVDSGAGGVVRRDPPPSSPTIDSGVATGVPPDTTVARSPSLKSVRIAEVPATVVGGEPAPATAAAPILAKKWDKLLTRIERNKAKGGPGVGTNGVGGGVRRSPSLGGLEAGKLGLGEEDGAGDEGRNTVQGRDADLDKESGRDGHIEAQEGKVVYKPTHGPEQIVVSVEIDDADADHEDATGRDRVEEDMHPRIDEASNDSAIDVRTEAEMGEKEQVAVEV
ncbi:hypothetical protein M427DRAFT_53509 [Gonapodya prolifera JEL478]|uniref:Uncharacterized protein n=1 Tax=Gonapodya prolifera (strain JEL478) TaxID=1344416 RepID=A0A139AP99_GONPJ|nr:hypothetical protein M427DRAFT_53509 [Gonapodya prolifera JEL478]|eukprot:KXS18548.1 hypothetical protein M427DRAFT_53509 [Gonapodya prolifera JEL478]